MPDTVKSYVDSATGMAQRAVGSVTGSTSTTENQTQDTTQKGEAPHAKLGPVTADPNTGATAKDNSTRSNGSWDQTVGSAKESLGNLVGSENLRQQGVEQNASGKEQEAKGQLKDLGQGVGDRVQGTIGGIGAAVKGDREEEEKWRAQHDEGKARQRGAEADIEAKGGK
ncbi:hypothetical protein ASPWEDRAFT_38047 [Aspergillus wentii DTO 134E9]|uniref:CsbD-like domain-containing protein n=1 Tax=Aspergillus wentii DTO 134E9 TaxID=1073089 RepID=A0A1L9RNK2_ASPWE|nr:uncharacterized protein ASPWEDRAFT_38047 [Aspergillus wentii DTO 134E9]KAI9934383.1 hypothetical protein MW887_005460 [Aspergillus wentii]OJJ36472.1 hypothetical protein ASPWEDRAFT_38047 [Aspergillus wentii DTO 134E9]